MLLPRLKAVNGKNDWFLVVVASHRCKFGAKILFSIGLFHNRPLTFKFDFEVSYGVRVRCQSNLTGICEVARRCGKQWWPEMIEELEHPFY